MREVVIINQKNSYIWYASYGSNLSRDRFLCYIQGGQAKGSMKTEVGCKDPSPPIKEETHIMNYPLYFAKASARWQGQGVAFVGSDRNKNEHTYSKKYLITAEQFFDVVKQENNGASLAIDLDEVIMHGSRTLLNSWYGTILYLGEKDGAPIFTFTSPWNLDVAFNQPSKEYLRMIIEGLKTNIGLDNSEIVNYLISKPGVEGKYNSRDIEKLIQPT